MYSAFGRDGFKKIILSRKGSDASSGGGYSPFDLSNGKYIVLPIPQKEEDAEKRNPLKSEDIKIKNAYFKGYDASNNPKGRVPRACPWVNEESFEGRQAKLKALSF